MDCTIIIIWNNKDIYEGLKKNIHRQTGVTYELIPIDNSKNEFIGARQTFQWVFKNNKINSDLIVFMHPDIRFLHKKSLENIIKYAKELECFGVIGVAGCQSGRKWIIRSNIINGKKKVMPGKPVNCPIKVQTVDECMFIMNKKYLKNHPFSDCPGWHLYAVEQCILAEKNGYHNYVVPAELWHFSAGDSLTKGYKDYMDTLETILSNIRNDKTYDIKELNTTVKQWKIYGIFPYIYRVYYRCKQKIKFILKDGFHAI